MEASRLGLRARQPVKTLWGLIVAAQALVRIPLWALVYLLPQLRQKPDWTWRQALTTRLMKYFLYHASVLQLRTPISLEPARDGDRFVVIQPADAKHFTGPAAPDEDVKPQPVGGIWFPSPLKPRSGSGEGGQRETVVIHFHGGAYVVGTGRTFEASFAASILLNEAGADRVLSIQYRLASNDGGRFPAALQDAISAYVFMLRDMGVPAADIVVSGDSAGGNLVLALLRYITEHGESVGLPAPGCAWLWSPWVDLAGVRDTEKWDSHPNQKTDYMPGVFGNWGVRALCEKRDPEDPYISPVRHPFRTETPMLIQTCGGEVLLGEDADLAKAMEGVEGNRVEFWVEEDGVHDVCFTGHMFGFKEPARRGARKAGEFLRKVKCRT